jgi:hypothetical protein
VIKKMLHYLFHCPTFWRVKPAFVCPCCQATYRCYWDGHDVNGKINVCSACAPHEHVKEHQSQQKEGNDNAD